MATQRNFTKRSGSRSPTSKPLKRIEAELRGDCGRMFRYAGSEAILSGPSDTGKTFASCVKMHAACLRYPGTQGLIARKTYASLAGTVTQTFKRVCSDYGVAVHGGETPTAFLYPNGSKVWLGGLDKPDKFLSAERDFIYVNQAEEITESDWELLASRATGRGAVMPYAQIFGDCNPSGSKHWIRSRAESGRLRLFVARHKDNPSLYSKVGELLPEGERRIAALSTALSGVRRKRLFEGVWATAEGAVYDAFDASVHVKKRERSEMKAWHLAIDDGYTNPAVVLDIGSDSDGRWHVFGELHQSGLMRETVVAHARRLNTQNARDAVAVDEAVPELVRELQAVGLRALGGKGKVLDGIRKIQDRLKVAGDGKPRLTVDPSCSQTINEFESYVWKKDKDEPVKEFEHAMDALRYLEDVLSEPTGAWDSAAIESAACVTAALNQHRPVTEGVSSGLFDEMNAI